ncbi:hypothetical protein KSD_31340 [Ktedonobacter sp. SOSP1-85]|nr:hypothetical protein KSD_31340 [Ktedonobacter sp. SOSP1-85]
MLTNHESEAYFFQALRAEAAGYLVKKTVPTELPQAILSVAQGGASLSQPGFSTDPCLYHRAAYPGTSHGQ